MKRKILYLGVLAIITIISMSLYGYSFVSPLIQKVFYVLYVFSSLYVLYFLREKKEIRLHHMILTASFVILVVIMIKNHILAFPLLFVFPLLASKQSHIVFKYISWLLYTGVCLLFCLVIGIRWGFVSTYTLSTEISPNGKQVASVIVHDEGALGGSIEVQYEKSYGRIIKRSRTIYRDRLNKIQIEWIGNDKIRINQLIIDVDTKGIIDRRKEKF